MKQIPTHMIQLEQIFTQLRNNKVRSVSITSSDAKEGCSTLSLAIAKRSAAQGRSTLLVDFHLTDAGVTQYFGGRYTDHESLSDSMIKNIVTTDIENLSVLPAPTKSKFLLSLRDKENTSKCVERWLERFDMVIVDCSPVNSKDYDIVPAETMCASTQNCIMVVLAGKTLEVKIDDAMNKLKKAGANILGTVINDQHNLPLADELCKATKTGEKYFPRWMEKLRNKIKESSFLNIDV